MTATRVLNPVVLSELRKITPSLNQKPPSVFKHIQRNLFGTVDSQEVHRAFNDELEKNQEKACRKWGFDFRTETPLPPTSSQYIWERISQQESTFAPEMYTLTRAAHIRPTTSTTQVNSYDLLLDCRAERSYSLTSTSSTDDEALSESYEDSQDEEMETVFKMPTVFKPENCEIFMKKSQQQQHHQRKRQPKITEYMKERKRLAQTPKKLGPPAKRTRTNSGSHSSNVNNFVGATGAHLISAHFFKRK